MPRLNFTHSFHLTKQLHQHKYCKYVRSFILHSHLGEHHGREDVDDRALVGHLLYKLSKVRRYFLFRGGGGVLECVTSIVLIIIQATYMIYLLSFYTEQLNL